MVDCNERFPDVDKRGLLRVRVGLPEMSGRDLHSILASGDFSGAESRRVRRALKSAINGRSKLPATIRLSQAETERNKVLECAVSALLNPSDRDWYDDLDHKRLPYSIGEQ